MPKIVDKPARRREIARTSMILFAEKGFEKSSVREIATRAGMGKGTFYDYFSDKEDLLIETAHIMFQDWHTVISGKIGHIKDPVDRLEALVTQGAKLGRSFEQMMVLYMDIWRCAVDAGTSQAFNRKFQGFLTEVKQAVTDLADQARDQGQIRKAVDTSALATALISLIDGLCLHYMILGRDMDMDHVCTSFFHTLKQGLLA